MNHPLPDHLDKIRFLETLVTEYTDHLNNIRHLHTHLECISEISDHNGVENYLRDFNELKRQLDLNGFLTICTLDLLVTSKNLLQSKVFWEEVYYLRHGYLTMYEALNTYADHSRWIRELVTTKYNLLNPKFVALSDKIKQFKKDYDYENTISKIRNETTAHIDFNFLKYFQIISSFDITKATESLIYFISILNEIQSFSKDLVANSEEFLREKGSELDLSIQNKMNTITEKFAVLNKSLKIQGIISTSN